MPDQSMIDISPVAAQIYGFQHAETSALENYGYALLAIAGGDRKISVDEMDWLMVNFGELLQLPEWILEKYRQFDYRTADLKAIIDQIHFESEGDIPRMILYDAIKMSRADDEYHDQESQAVREAASLLGLDLGSVKALENLVDTERTVSNLRLTLFEVTGDVSADEMPTEENRIKHNAWIKEHFGYQYTTQDSLQSFLLTLLVIAGFNGKIGEAEFEWLENFARAADMPNHFIDDLRTVDYHQIDLGGLLGKFVVDRKMNMARILIYLSIHMARADGSISATERDLVFQAARSLGETNATVVEIESLLDLERSLEGLRKCMFRISV